MTEHQQDMPLCIEQMTQDFQKKMVETCAQLRRIEYIIRHATEDIHDSSDEKYQHLEGSDWLNQSISDSVTSSSQDSK
jgi:hypothetical protein